MSDAGWKAAKRLGVQTVMCERCADLMPVRLPEAAWPPRRINDGYWRVERSNRSAPLSQRSDVTWIFCSQGCAQEKSKELTKDHRYHIPRLRFSIHGPYVPYVES